LIGHRLGTLLHRAPDLLEVKEQDAPKLTGGNFSIAIGAVHRLGTDPQFSCEFLHR
jgi:hypothetical protein